MKNKVQQIFKDIDSFTITSTDSLEEFRLKYLSKKGIIPELFKGFKTVSPDQR
ncbi:MAG: phenylalanine--tRNA ligase subunit alpha, partial [Bacteroidetes bacterium]|nr:phenylalanine--tRNA ligase subunit alpha [Bacteroidota bacterium]